MWPSTRDRGGSTGISSEDAGILPCQEMVVQISSSGTTLVGLDLSLLLFTI
jgi:hypothetical protein